MTARAPWLGALLQQLLGDNEPLVGDLLEECPHRSRAWFWRQVMFAVLARAMTSAAATMREPQRLSGGLASVAMFLLVSFQIVVAGSLLNDLLRRLDPAQVTRITHPEWTMFVVLLSLPAAWVIGRAMSRLHRRSRVATVLGYGASAAIVATVTLFVLAPAPAGFFLPSVAHQITAAMVFVVGLGIGSSRLRL